MPVGWSAGKWGEWYPDVLDEEGRLGVKKPKYFWQEGWRRQHDRLLTAASAMTGRIPLFLSGDLHALGHGWIEEYGRVDLRRNPVHSVLTGPVSTGPQGWPSAARGTPPLPASGLHLMPTLEATEQNGFTIVDFTPEAIEMRMYSWKLDRPESELDSMKLLHRVRLERKTG
jgi:hypothetical protein